ncbi:MAG TPA: hypothetical protein VMT32_01480, partial [Bryobacteraceae bacterium]|nr:hypothetical protein [Bryobacteraceae bacterium]
MPDHRAPRRVQLDCKIDCEVPGISNSDNVPDQTLYQFGDSESGKKIPAETLRQLTAYFADTRLLIRTVRCVVTDSANFEWHHLSQSDPKDHRISNIVPLAGPLNKNLYHSLEADTPLERCLGCEKLKEKAEEAFFQDGQAARAYGCSRIAYYVAQYTPRSFSYQLDCARRALYYARHRLNYQILQELLNDTIQQRVE